MVDRGDAPPEITTFGQLGERARRLITFLRERGVGEGDRIAVMCAQSAETAVAHVAAYLIRAQGQYLPPACHVDVSSANQRRFGGWRRLLRHRRLCGHKGQRQDGNR